MNQREIILVPFPFSDQSGFKVRPALVISNNSFNKKSEDVIICGITSNINENRNCILIDASSLEEGKLYEISGIKVESILKINKQLAIKSIAKINENVFSKVIEKLIEILK